MKPEKRLFEAFRLEQASAGALLSATMVLRGIAALAKGHGVGVTKGDVRQLPGVLIIGTDGRILFSHHATGPGHRLYEALPRMVAVMHPNTAAWIDKSGGSIFAVIDDAIAFHWHPWILDRVQRTTIDRNGHPISMHF